MNQSISPASHWKALQLLDFQYEKPFIHLSKPGIYPVSPVSHYVSRSVRVLCHVSKSHAAYRIRHQETMVRPLGFRISSNHCPTSPRIRWWASCTSGVTSSWIEWDSSLWWAPLGKLMAIKPLLNKLKPRALVTTKQMKHQNGSPHIFTPDKNSSSSQN